jgi:uracil phosphoribosyltransferase
MKPLKDSQFKEVQYTLSAREHRYGDQVHILSDPFLHTQLAKLCSIETTQPWINELIISLYSTLMKTVINHEFPQKQMITDSRMSTSHPEGIFESSIIDPSTKVVSVNLARAGTLPSHTCYHLLNYLMDPKQVRQDHISIARQTDQAHHVTGSTVSGHKIGGSVDDSIVIIPDPMGATGATLVETLDLYKTYGKAKKYIALHCIVTPEYLKHVKEKHPELIVYAMRLDRGFSSEKVLNSIPGTYWSEERGLNDQQYIVPGGGGFGEILNNAYV